MQQPMPYGYASRCGFNPCYWGQSPNSRRLRLARNGDLTPITLQRLRHQFKIKVFWKRFDLEAQTLHQLEHDGVATEVARIVGVSRYITNPDRATCEFSLVVADDYKGRGLGSRLMLSIMDVAREKGLTEIDGLVLASNPVMLKLMKGLGFKVKPFPEDLDFKLVTQTL